MEEMVKKLRVRRSEAVVPASDEAPDYEDLSQKYLKVGVGVPEEMIEAPLSGAQRAAAKGEDVQSRVLQCGEGCLLQVSDDDYLVTESLRRAAKR